MLIGMKSVNSFDIQMESIMAKGHGNIRKAYKEKYWQIAIQKKVYRNEVRSSKRYTFFMSNLQGLCIFNRFFVDNLSFQSMVKKLVEIIQFSIKIRCFFLNRFIGFL